MADPYRDIDDDSKGIPRWVKFSLIIGVIVVLLVGAVMLFGGQHNPMRHAG